MDIARVQLEAATVSATLAVAGAKVLTTDAAIDASNALFELAGTQSAREGHNFDRHWQNARTHTLHDPVRWKFHVVRAWLGLGVFVAGGTIPKRRPA
ncbi:alkylation response protein AidB-like acyl-CoA dehydrogenase [Rhizobium mongolense]|uniref:Alkylation response protein AidB-like acyl-CoA dehydrogenase n=1 Tax=Rhizobium mongolense TaxID=57676 RepID=A0ABR6IH85_9HYPH|nr:alkylation response protein AidB-like acyl-CoA dehydrogenase [Rhizobium mongolense]